MTLAVVVALVATACMFGRSDSDSGSAAVELDDDTLVLVDRLAEAGIAVYDDLGDRDPIAEVNELYVGEAGADRPVNEVGIDDVTVTASYVQDGEPVDISVDVFVDPDPEIIEMDELLAGGDRRTLEGVGDTTVYLLNMPDGSVSFDADGLGIACAVEVVGAWDFRSGGVNDLGFCAHPDDLRVAYTGDIVIPLVVFARTDEPVTIELTPIE